MKAIVMQTIEIRTWAFFDVSSRISFHMTFLLQNIGTRDRGESESSALLVAWYDTSGSVTCSYDVHSSKLISSSRNSLDPHTPILLKQSSIQTGLNTVSSSRPSHMLGRNKDMLGFPANPILYKNSNGSRIYRTEPLARLQKWNRTQSPASKIGVT